MSKKAQTPAKVVPVFTLRFPEHLTKVLDSLRREEDDLPTRSEMVRRLVERAGVAKGLGQNGG